MRQARTMAVYLDMQGVETTGNDGETVLINVNAGIYNLLDFSDKTDTIIATGTLETATVRQIRFILGTNNSVVIDGVSFPLSIPSADQSGLKIQVHQILQEDVPFSVLLNFDVYASIVDEGNGTYKLKPVIRTVEAASSGAITGSITPLGTAAFVISTFGVTYSSSVSAAGKFEIPGLPAGTYMVVVTPSLPLSPVTRTNITVTTGVITDMGTINL